ncbi:MAG: sigma-54 interaction domain-containing protein [Acidiferrobacter sp.]
MPVSTAIDTKSGAGQVVDFHGLIGCGPEMCGLRLRLKKAASTDAPVLLTGASGSGKELAARAIHKEGARRHRPFVAVNCAGISESLWESEFFGYKAGAFSGAARDQDGLFAAAHGGTLFLDELGEMSLASQAKLLRVLEGGWLRPVGALRERRVDVRIVAATNRDLSQAVEQGRFRHDLLFRIDVLGVSLPDLAGRFNDIAVLAGHFLQGCRREVGGATPRLRPDALRALQDYAFPGNARELRNIVQSAAVFARDAQIALEDLPASVRRQYGGIDDGCRRDAQDDGLATGDLVTLEEWKQAYVRNVLRRVGGNKRAAARILGIERRTLYRWLTED